MSLDTITLNGLYAYDEQEGAEIIIEGSLKAKVIKRHFGDIYYLLDEPIEGKRVVKEWVNEPIGTDEPITLFSLLKGVDDE